MRLDALSGIIYISIALQYLAIHTAILIISLPAIAAAMLLLALNVKETNVIDLATVGSEEI